MKMRTDFTSIDHYISEADEKVRESLQQIREVIREAAPNTTECISYGMPAFRLRVVVYFAALKITSVCSPNPQELQHSKKNSTLTNTQRHHPISLDEPIPTI
ncbi:MAG: DUF1801 domain-containing protein [Ignavibacteriales bacterium]|nr:DUF1801 domain-containing protein [Ignavibacteriales bacterium]